MPNKQRKQRDTAVYVSATEEEKQAIYDLLERINFETGLERPRILYNALLAYLEVSGGQTTTIQNQWDGEGF